MKTPCGPCDFKQPESTDEVDDFIEYWEFASSQWRMGPRGPIGLDYVACKVVSEALDYPFDDVTMMRLRMLEHEVLEKIRKDGERNN